MYNNTKRGFINIQLFGENPEGAETPQEQGTQIDYEAEYKKAVAERDAFKSEVEKQKQLKDKYATENADYKRKEVEKMSDEEKKARELQNLIDSKNKMEAELKQMRLEKDLLANGFTADESKKLIEGNFSVKDIADIMKARLVEQEKSIKAESLKKSTPEAPMGNGTTTEAKGLSEFAKFQKSQKESQNDTKVEF